MHGIPFPQENNRQPPAPILPLQDPLLMKTLVYHQVVRVRAGRNDLQVVKALADEIQGVGVLWYCVYCSVLKKGVVRIDNGAVE